MTNTDKNKIPLTADVNKFECRNGRRYGSRHSQPLLFKVMQNHLQVTCVNVARQHFMKPAKTPE